MSETVLELELHARVPPAEPARFRHAVRRLHALRIAAGATSALFALALVLGAPGVLTLALLLPAAAAAALMFDAQRRIAARPEHIEVAADGITLKYAAHATTLAWCDIAIAHRDLVRGRIAIAPHGGRALEIDDDLDDAPAFLDLVALHLDASRRSDISPPLERAHRPALFGRVPWLEIGGAASALLALLLGMLQHPAYFGLAVLGAPALAVCWTRLPHRVVVDDSAVWLVRRFARDVIPLRAIGGVAFTLDGRFAEPAMVIEHRERGRIALRGFGAAALPMFDAVSAALRGQRALRQGAGAAVRSSARMPARRSAARTAGILAAALAVVLWGSVFTGAPLHTAVRTGSAVMLNAALLMGAPRNAADEHGLTPLHHAAALGSDAMVQRLVRAGADVNAPSAHSRLTPLHAAARSGSVAAARALLDAGADVNARSALGRTPLAHALVFPAAPDVAFARTLLEAGADPNAADDDGRAPLHHAAARAHAAWIPVLVRAGARLDARDHGRRAPLHHAVRSRNTSAITVLLDAGADIDARGPDGRTALALAAHDATTPLPMVDVLLASRARADIPGDDGWNAVQLAAWVNNAPALELFGRRRAAIDARTPVTEPALHLAIRRHNVEAVRALLRAGASPSRPHRGTTGYELAVQSRNPTITALVRMR